MEFDARTQIRLDNAIQGVIQKRAQLSPTLRFEVASSGIKRRSIVKQIGLAAKHYDLSEEIDAFVTSAGCATAAGLGDRDLQALSAWLDDVVDRQSVCADSPHAPPPGQVAVNDRLNGPQRAGGGGGGSSNHVPKHLFSARLCKP